MITKKSSVSFAPSKQKAIKGTLVLIVLDGWGESELVEGNAVKLAKTPVMDQLVKQYPKTLLNACGTKVGLPHNQKGNSEAGHMNLGAGRIAEQDVVTISRAIADRTFDKNTAFNSVINHVKKHDSDMHLLGLLSGAESAHVEMPHLYALLKLLKRKNVSKVFIHFFTDGRDAPQHEALKYLKRVKEKLVGAEKIASICGRFYAMDRNKVWYRTEAAYNLLTQGHGFKVENEQEAILQAYNRGETDEYIQPTVIMEGHKPVATIKDGDGIIFFNLRSDRARQLSKAFVQEDFCEKNHGCFLRPKFIKNMAFAAMTDFGPDLDHILTAFPSRDLSGTLPMALKDFKQLYISETEKYAHVTYFFNGGYADPVAGEARVIIPSPSVKSYAEKPEMSAYEVTDTVIKYVKDGYDFILLNLCNPDMVGHTGVLDAGIKAVEACDVNLGRIVKEVLKGEGVVLVTADHGNVEEMINLETGEVDTEHSHYPVPFILVSEKHKKAKLIDKGILANVAPTVLDILGLPKTKEMNQDSLIL
ncbi:MAG: 2,3-bisphosphoglycerate-independent phosphoglycerate mutase [Parcubacteria group bacterium GW2011_GWF2_45_11]|nr:MAG: 2,3-bisphosphoglycerate-independent phosphoglycerate mutase [Parcubacteria group bacterium GW2011_GWF2_45_11]